MFHPRGPTLAELARQALSSTERGYDLLAPKFEYTPFRTPEPLLLAVAAELGPPGSVERAIDLCCGTGAAMGVLRPLCRRAIVGVDFSSGMLREAERLLADAPGQAEICLLKADVCRLSMPDRFDLATCFGALGHIPPGAEHRFIQSVATLLQPGGRFVFVTCEHPPWYAPGALLARGFNGAMRVRNALLSPPFLMYYLRFTLPGVRALLEQHGLSCEVRPLEAPQVDRRVRLVIARRSG
ncbi:MAG: class I SAM-dependent methyltransferase [Deltaproteobacteria bacterium]|nr:class I SAM-dependent methyltransferase [Deltaproteobacteria bacterium]MBW2535121.1 class I SAM-dependent methyltransferase [Deltaproteobacteria bacterium]